MAFSAAPQSGESRPVDRSVFLVLLTASLVSSLIMFDSNIVAVSLPAIGRSLDASFTDVQWVISVHRLLDWQEPSATNSEGAGNVVAQTQLRQS